MHECIDTHPTPPHSTPPHPTQSRGMPRVGGWHKLPTLQRGSSGSRGGGRGFNPPLQRFLGFFACQYMKIPTGLDPNPPPPPLRRILAQNPPPVKEFLDPPLRGGGRSPPFPTPMLSSSTMHSPRSLSSVSRHWAAVRETYSHTYVTRLIST